MESTGPDLDRGGNSGGGEKSSNSGYFQEDLKRFPDGLRVGWKRKACIRMTNVLAWAPRKIELPLTEMGEPAGRANTAAWVGGWVVDI